MPEQEEAMARRAAAGGAPSDTATRLRRLTARVEQERVEAEGPPEAVRVEGPTLPTKEEARREFDSIHEALRQIIRDTEDRPPTGAEETRFRGLEVRLRVLAEQEDQRRPGTPEVFSSEFDEVERLRVAVIEERLAGFLAPEESTLRRAVRQFFVGPEDGFVEGGVVTGLVRMLRGIKQGAKVLRFVRGTQKTMSHVSMTGRVGARYTRLPTFSGFVIRDLGTPMAKVEPYTVTGATLLEDGRSVLLAVRTGSQRPEVLARIFGDLRDAYAKEGLVVKNVSVVQRSFLVGPSGQTIKRFNHFVMDEGPFGTIRALPYARDFRFVVPATFGAEIVVGGALWPMDPEEDAFRDVPDTFSDGTTLVQRGQPSYEGVSSPLVIDWGYVEEVP